MQNAIIFQNPAAITILGWQTSELIGQPAHALVHHTRLDGTPYPQAACPIQATLRDGMARSVEDEVFWHRDGTPVPVAYASTVMLNEAGDTVGVVVTFTSHQTV